MGGSGLGLLASELATRVRSHFWALPLSTEEHERRGFLGFCTSELAAVAAQNPSAFRVGDFAVFEFGFARATWHTSHANAHAHTVHTQTPVCSTSLSVVDGDGHDGGRRDGRGREGGGRGSDAVGKPEARDLARAPVADRDAEVGLRVGLGAAVLALLDQALGHEPVEGKAAAGAPARWGSAPCSRAARPAHGAARGDPRGCPTLRAGCLAGAVRTLAEVVVGEVLQAHQGDSGRASGTAAAAAAALDERVTEGGGLCPA